MDPTKIRKKSTKSSGQLTLVSWLDPVMAFSASYSWQAATDPCTLDSVDLMWLRTLDVRKSDKALEKIHQSKYKKHPSGQLKSCW